MMPMIDTSELMVSPKHTDWVERALAKLDSEAFVAKLAEVEELAYSDEDHDGFWGANSWARPYDVRDGTLVIPVHGMLLNKFPYQFGSMATGYEYIEAAIKRGVDDRDVDRIVLWTNSPGGLVAGCFDACDYIFESRGIKPIIAIVDESAYSAAYALASSADEMIVARTGGVGHIGVLGTHVDYSGSLAAQGVKHTFVAFGSKKTHGRPELPLSKEAESDMQNRVDALGEIFVATVARNRGLEEQAVRDTEASTFMPQPAIEAGLADKVGSFESTLAAFAEGFTEEDGDETMANQTEAEIAAAQEAAIATAKEEARTAALAEGAQAERARRAEILGSDEAASRPVAANRVADTTDMSVKDALAFLGGLPEEAAATNTEETPAPAEGTPAFEAAMNGGGNPEIAAENGGAPAGGAPVMSPAERALRAAGLFVEES